MRSNINGNLGTVYPFPAIVGQEDLKLALLLNAVNPRVEGVLVRGEKGTAKSTAVRGLAALLPDIEVVRGCLFSLSPEEAAGFCGGCGLCHGRRPTDRRPVPLVDLPLNATEDRVIGGIDFEETVRSGKRVFLPGLLAAAHRGILYVDEVNLLDDHLVDSILSAAASGVNTIEREGVSLSHPARFLLVGTMNPEEGELRPQFLDRFGLCVEVKAEEDREARVLTMERREAFDADPKAFCAAFQNETRKLRQQIGRARRLLHKVIVSGRLRALISELCVHANAAGHRADLIIEQAARAMAAMADRTEVEEEDILKVAPFALRHRQREIPPPPKQEKKQENRHNQQRDSADREPRDQGNEEPQKGSARGNAPQPHAKEGGDAHGPSGANAEDKRDPQAPVRPDVLERVFEVGATFRVKPFAVPKDRVFRRGSGRRSRSRVSGLQGRYVKSTHPRGTGDVALDATLRAAAPHQGRRTGRCAVVIEAQDIREKVRERRIGNFLLFVVDASGSMGARARMVATKGAILSLLLDAYQKRDKVAMIAFNKSEARLLLPPTSSIDTAARLLAELPVGGRTPLGAGLVKAAEVLRAQLVRDPTSRPMLILITDGRCNVSLGSGKPLEECLALGRRLARDRRVRTIVVDTETPGLLRFALAAPLAEALDATYVKTDDLRAETLLQLAGTP
ncbi:MAG: putative cobaltochelatase [Desulfacinum sp.]|jgi:magnesium chelatase subunit D|nr:putative cobaltochelatase [Desulfacinum sp.]MBZ4658081.1 cobaltochelatase subunit [Desulfacinum sp.]